MDQIEARLNDALIMIKDNGELSETLSQMVEEIDQLKQNYQSLKHENVEIRKNIDGVISID